MGYFVINTGTNALPPPNDTELHLMFRLGVNLVGQRVVIPGERFKNKRLRGVIIEVEISPGWGPNTPDQLGSLIVQTGHGRRKRTRWCGPEELQLEDPNGQTVAT